MVMRNKVRAVLRDCKRSLAMRDQVSPTPGVIARLPAASKNELQAELNQSRIGIRVRAGHLAECRAAHSGVGRRILRPIEDVEEFGAEFEAHSFIGAKTCSFEE